MSLRGVAKDTLRILEQGAYTTPNGDLVVIRGALREAVEGTRTHPPAALDALLADGPPAAARSLAARSLAISVTGERTQEAARRLVVDEGVTDLVLLNYASARNVGGGFLKGARAQEEDLMRCSGLYACVREQSAYYEANRAVDSMLYTDHLIYSPGVPFFRGKNRDLLPAAYQSAVITAPAPNAGQALRRDPSAGPRIASTLRRRAGKILALAESQGHRTVLLGAWGCGVFQNDPEPVADAFGQWLRSPRFSGSFSRAIFAVYEPGKRTDKRKIFSRVLVSGGGGFVG